MFQDRYFRFFLNLVLLSSNFLVLVLVFKLPLVQNWQQNLPVWGYPLLGVVMGSSMLWPFLSLRGKEWVDNSENSSGGPNPVFSQPASGFGQILARFVLLALSSLIVALLLGIWASLYWDSFSFSDWDVVMKTTVFLATVLAVWQASLAILINVFFKVNLHP